MKKDEILGSMEYVDSALINKAESYSSAKKNKHWVKWGAMAACLCLVLCGVILTDMFGKAPSGTDNPGNSVIDTLCSPFSLKAYAIETDGDIFISKIDGNMSVPVSIFETKNDVRGFVFSWGNGMTDSGIYTVSLIPDGEQDVDEMVSWDDICNLKLEPGFCYYLLVPDQTKDAPYEFSLLLPDDEKGTLENYKITITEDASGYTADINVIRNPVIYDIDNDGKAEMCELALGRTSGLFSIVITVSRDNAVVYKNMFTLPWGGELTLGVYNGSLKIAETNSQKEDNTEDTIYHDVFIQDGKIVITNYGDEIYCFDCMNSN